MKLIAEVYGADFKTAKGGKSRLLPCYPSSSLAA
jgi:hypothetical protein